MSKDATERTIPLILVAVGLGLYAISAFVHAGAAGVAPTMIAVIIGGNIQTVLLIGAAFLVSSMLSVSFGDFKSAILKFAGATLAAGGLGAIIPFGGIISAFVFLGLILWLFELEVVYAIALAIAYFLLSLVVVVILRSMFA